MQKLQKKSIEELDSKNKSENSENPNPYIRRYGSYIKSHFSHSRCEIFNSSEDEDCSNVNQIPTQQNSLNSMGSMTLQMEFNRPGNNSSLHNLDRKIFQPNLGKSIYGGKSVNHIKNSPSIDRENSNEQVSHFHNSEKIDVENTIQNKQPVRNSLEMELDDDDQDNRSELIINRSRKSSYNSLKSLDCVSNNLAEPGTEFLFKIDFQNGLNQKTNNHNLIKEIKPCESLNSTANNSMFKEKEDDEINEGSKIEEEEDDRTNMGLDIETD